MKKIYLLLVLVFCLLSLFLNLYKKSSLPGFTADEAAFGYNSYSILKTGADEYGNKLPLRLKSFGDYKMPLYSYLSIPFVGTLGLNENSARALNSLVSFLLPLVVFFLALELFGSENIALLAAFLTSVTLGLHLIGRQAHESYLAVFFISLTTFFFLKDLKKRTFYSPFFLLLALFSYQSSRIFALFFLGATLYFWFKKRVNKNLVLALIGVVAIFLITDIMYNPTRVANLLFFKNPGFTLKINEYVTEGGSRLFYNKLTVGVKDVALSYLSYFSPEFWVIKGDDNIRFGYPGMSSVSPLFYIFIFIGLYYLFKNKEKWRFYILSLFLISPLTASLTWNGVSLSRSLFILIPAILLASYGFFSAVRVISKKHRIYFYFPFILILMEIFFLFYSWDFYLNHYPKKPEVVRSWQGGYRQIAQYVKDNYQKTDRFYITQKNGQPYIFLLFYLEYPPQKYQMQAKLSAPDQYGFGQVLSFDKFVFEIPRKENLDKLPRRTVIIGYPEDFNILDINENQKIIINDQNILGVYESK